MKKTLFLLIFVFSIVSCNRNRLKTDEKSLEKQILTEEQQRAHEEQLRMEREKQLADSIAKLPKGFRFKEERRVEPDHPPVVIDIAGNIEKVKDFKLSNIIKSIRYIRLQSPTDSSFVGELINDIPIRNQEKLLKEELPFSIQKNKDFIVAFNFLGVLLYNSKGELLRIISKNEFTGIGLSKRGIVGGSHSTFKGAQSGTIRLVRDKLYYVYEDDVNRISNMLEVDCNNLPISLSSKNEKSGVITGLGRPVAVTGRNSYSSIPLGSGLYSKTGNVSSQENMLTIYNSKGDTVCSFEGNQKIENYSKTVGRTPDWGTRLFYNDNFYFREPHSDTIFSVVPPNRLIPAFLIDLGKYKVERLQDGMNPGFDLSEKFLPKTISLTDKYIFIYYTKGYNSPHARRNKLVKFFYAVYDRSSDQLWHLPADPDDYRYGLENDLDGGISFWPEKGNANFYATSSISAEGEFLLTVKGKDLKEQVATEEFKNSLAPQEKKEELVQFAKRLNDNETIVIVMK